MSGTKPVEPERDTGISRAQVRDFLATLLQEVCEIPGSAIREEATIDGELEMESVQMVQLQVAIEQEYDVSIDFLEVLRLNTFGKIVGYIHDLATNASHPFPGDAAVAAAEKHAPR